MVVKNIEGNGLEVGDYFSYLTFFWLNHLYSSDRVKPQNKAKKYIIMQNACSHTNKQE